MEKDLARIALFAALIAILGVIPKIALGFGVPITAQSLGVMLAGAVLGARRGGLAVLLFVFAVALGLPLLAGGRGGPGVFVGPSTGFIIGFPVAAFVTGLVVERLRMVPPAISAGLGAFIGGILVMYAFGTVGMAIVLKKSLVEAALLNTAYIPGDLLKAGLTGMLIAAVAKLRPEMLSWYRASGQRI
ncbi:biotin transporter BioY [Paracoccus alkanivorans]|uniref:Biotin transporter n=1 Tax=Paracoccus alkanivorans TaxID=2116655 RepID=A0A3M0M8F9_9RHOB|nr:biotin transporter BioY [Paracoccus alkanivorans]RMC33685.1 biotin transporter BioY [Paracoccus alkanivorans]